MTKNDVLQAIRDATPPKGHITVIAGEKNGASYQWNMPIVEKRDLRRKAHYGACENNLSSMIQAVEEFMDRRVFPDYDISGLLNVDERRFHEWHIVIKTETSVFSLEIGGLHNE